MKTRNQISGFAVICAVCASTMSGAWAASSVRTLGGAGTYSSAASASSVGAVTAANAGTARAGSMRVTGTSGKSATTASVATPSTSGSTAGRAATAPRLSIGKVLSGATSVSRPGGGSSGTIDPGLAGLPDDVDELRTDLAGLDNRVDVLEGRVDGLDDSVAAIIDALGGSTGLSDFGAYVTSIIGSGLPENTTGNNVVLGIVNGGEPEWLELATADDID